MLKQEGTATIPGYTTVTNNTPAASAVKKKFEQIFHQANNSRKELCPVRDIMSRVSDKWSMLTIYALGGYGTLRFSELKRKIGDISQRMLTVTLRNLEADGLITRKIYAEVPPRVEYELTELGHSLMNQFVLFAEWAIAHGKQIIGLRQKARSSKLP